MGMAASQARLLSLTSRLHDVELRAQSIESQKIALATQKDELYENYCEALDATKFQIAFMGADGSGKNWEIASFKNMCTFMGDDRYHDYALKDTKTGFLIESKDVVENYNKFKNDKYAFAWAMLGYDMDGAENADTSWGEVGTTAYARNAAGDGSSASFSLTPENLGGGSSVMSATEWEVYNNASGDDKTVLENLFKNIEDAVAEGDTTKRDEAVTAFRNKLYELPSTRDAIFASFEGTDSKTTWTDISSEFNYYCRKFEAIQQAGGCKEIDPQFESGSQGETWLKNMVEAGLIVIQENDKINGANAEWKDTSVATSTNGNYISEVQDDKDLKKAEAEYEHELSIINRKDTKFDKDLSKLETERTSITTEMDAIKQVRNDNIDRTFGIFS